jgi:hypothetical protein
LKIFLHGTATIPEIQKMAPLKDKLIDDEPQNLESVSFGGKRADHTGQKPTIYPNVSPTLW